MHVSPVDTIDLVSGLRLSADEASHESGMTAHVVREKRALVIGATGKLDFISTPIERDILPFGQPNMPQATNMADMQASLQDQQRWMDGLVTRYDANRMTGDLAVGPHRIEIVRETGSGYAYLTKVNADRNANPPIDGRYIVEFDKRGEQSRIHLLSLEEQMGIKITLFAPASNGGFYLLGTDQNGGNNHIILIDPKGNPLAHGVISKDGGAIVEGIMADVSGVWLYGHQYRNKDRSRVWIDRADFK